MTPDKRDDLKQYISTMLYDPKTPRYVISPGKMFDNMVASSILPQSWATKLSIRKKVQALISSECTSARNSFKARISGKVF
jgi:hypothetical protein